MPAPSPSTKPSRCRSNGREAFCGASLRVESAVKTIEASYAERVDHGMRSPREHQVGVAMSHQGNCFANSLSTCGTGGEAVEIWPFQSEMCGEVAGGGVQLLLGFLFGMKCFHAAAAEGCHVEAARFRLIRLRDERHQIMKILNTFAAAEVYAEARAIDTWDIINKPGIAHRFLRCRGGELAVNARTAPAARIRNEIASDRSRESERRI